MVFLFTEQPTVSGLAGQTASDISQYIVQPFAFRVGRGISGEEPRAARSSASTDHPSRDRLSSADEAPPTAMRQGLELNAAR